MTSVGETRLTLRIVGNDLIPGEITKLLGGSPGFAHRRGEKISGKQGQSRTTKFGAWMRTARVNRSGDLDQQVHEVFSGLTKDADIWRDLAKTYEVIVYCSLFLDETNEGTELSPETMLMLGSRGIRIGLDIYAPRRPISND